MIECNMFISSRKDFDDPDNISVDGHHIREIDLNTNKKLRDLFLSALTHLSVLLTTNPLYSAR